MSDNSNGRRELVTVRSSEPDWLERVLGGVWRDGAALVLGVIPEERLVRTRAAMRRAQAKIHAQIGPDRMMRAGGGEFGIIRTPMVFDDVFYEYLQTPEILDIIDATVGPTAVMHLQNAFILPALPPGDTPMVSQNSWHMDFIRVLNGAFMSINTYVAIDEFTDTNGATVLSLGNKQVLPRPSDETLDATAVEAVAPAGSLVVFDSTLWHRAGINRSTEDRLGMNMQFTKSYLKQQIDYVRAIGDEKMESLPPRTQQFLGWYTRVPTSIEEFYQPPEKRLYRAGQG